MKKPKSTSVEAAVQAAINATKGPIPAPDFVTLRAQDRPFWDAILLARARDEWTEADLVIAGQLARCQRDIEVESALLEVEGTVLTPESGRVYANPRAGVLEQLARRELAIMRSLRMTGRVSGDSRNEAGRRSLERQARKNRAEIESEEDELLAS
jgi:hypothetical protein